MGTIDDWRPVKKLDGRIMIENCKEPAKSCFSCIHHHLSSSSEPCVNCMRGSYTKTNDYWKPKVTTEVSMSNIGQVPYVNNLTPESKITSDGGSSEYYDIPEDSKTLNDIIEAREMSFARGNAFKALYRLDRKSGVDAEYDLNKIEYFTKRMKLMLKKGIKL